MIYESAKLVLFHSARLGLRQWTGSVRNNVCTSPSTDIFDRHLWCYLSRKIPQRPRTTPPISCRSLVRSRPLMWPSSYPRSGEAPGSIHLRCSQLIPGLHPNDQDITLIVRTVIVCVGGHVAEHDRRCDALLFLHMSILLKNHLPPVRIRQDREYSCTLNVLQLIWIIQAFIPGIFPAKQTGGNIRSLRAWGDKLESLCTKKATS